ncbi:hypothetical protein Pla22_03680 [Rubripirellula amarantea]|uniref:GYF domain-containing protein n=1 Tax=Rubripirellula amarantea TaxID=2527999 RepID=A0A5C5WSI1_9BACT|nr:DUF4339 domain-containing protein [Rubripirellula amarantea]TWT52742.1 hypothetical protein Pla22_03680 [Rubripirellula amarantea]
MTDWFIQRDNAHEDIGPLRPKELLDLVREGKVIRTTMIRKDDSTWFEAGQVGGLFEAAMRPTIEFFCPQCEHEVTEPPVVCNYCGREIYKAITKITENSITPGNDHSITGQAGRSVRNWLKKKKIAKDDDEKPNTP